ncbi:MAG: arginase, partial [Comamonadaceae bacterium]
MTADRPLPDSADARNTVRTPSPLIDQVALIGVPADVGAGVRGASMGPQALRVAGLAQALIARGLTVSDLGDLAGPLNPGESRVDGYRHLSETVTWNHLVHDAVYGALASGQLPIMLGGDHCLALGSVSAVARRCRETGRPLRVLWLDAHTDFNTSALSPSGNTHGMPLACLCGYGPAELTSIGGQIPAVATADVRQVGIRSVDDGERELIHQAGIQVFDMRSIDELGMRAVMEQALAGMAPDTHLHVSFDVDFLDPQFAPGVGTTVQGGPTYREAQLCMEMIADCQRLGSLDIVELNPALDVRNQTATLAVELVESIFGKSILMRSRWQSAIISMH